MIHRTNRKTQKRRTDNTHTPADTHFPLSKHQAADHTLQRPVSFFFGFGFPLQNLAIIFLRREGSSHCLVHFQLPHVGCDRLSLNSTVTFVSGDNFLQRILGHILKFSSPCFREERSTTWRDTPSNGSHSTRATPRHDFFAIDRRQWQWCEPSWDSLLRFATLQG